MALRRVFVDSVSDGRAVVGGPRAHHLARVVRLKAEEAVEVSDGAQAWVAVTESVGPKEVLFRLQEALPPEPEFPRLELHLAVIKLPRFEWAIEKAAELGVSAIVPVAAERSDGVLIKGAPKRVERWARIAEEAAQQARRLGPPSIESPMGLAEALARPAAARVFVDFAGEEPSNSMLAAASGASAVAVLVGPEGGWTEEELALARAAGAAPITLGNSVLRSETAAAAALSIIGHLLRTMR